MLDADFFEHGRPEFSVVSVERLVDQPQRIQRRAPLARSPQRRREALLGDGLAEDVRRLIALDLREGYLSQESLATQLPFEAKLETKDVWHYLTRGKEASIPSASSNSSVNPA